MSEEWRPIAGYDGQYSVSNLGRVRSETRVVNSSIGTRTLPGRIMSLSLNGMGCPSLGLKKDGHKINERVHILVADAFLGPCPEGMKLVRKNDDVMDAHLENLHYVTKVNAEPAGAANLKRVLVVNNIGGWCPVQAEGTLEGVPFYFRSRGNAWSFSLMGDPEKPEQVTWRYVQRYGTWPEAGYITEIEARSFIRRAARLYLNGAKSVKIVELI